MLQQHGGHQAVLWAAAQHVQTCTLGSQDKRKAQLRTHKQLLDSRHVIRRQSRTHKLSLTSSSATSLMQVPAGMLKAGRETRQVSLTPRHPISHSHHYAFHAVQANILQCFHQSLVHFPRAALITTECLLPGWLVQQENKPYQVDFIVNFWFLILDCTVIKEAEQCQYLSPLHKGQLAEIPSYLI